MSHKHTSLGTHYIHPNFSKCFYEHLGRNDQVDMLHNYSAEGNELVVTATLLLQWHKGRSGRTTFCLEVKFSFVHNYERA